LKGKLLRKWPGKINEQRIIEEETTTQTTLYVLLQGVSWGSMSLHDDADQTQLPVVRALGVNVS